MAVLEESWLSMAETLGFKSEFEMLQTLYVVEHFSFKEIGRILGVAPWSVRRRVIAYSLPVRTRGGPNRQGKRKLAELSDQELFESSYKEISDKYNTNQSTVYAERKLRRLCTSVQ